MKRAQRCLALFFCLVFVGTPLSFASAAPYPTVTLDFNILGDGEYRSYQGASWVSLTNRALEEADDEWYTFFQIDCYNRSHKNWFSPADDPNYWSYPDAYTMLLDAQIDFPKPPTVDIYFCIAQDVTDWGGGYVYGASDNEDFIVRNVSQAENVNTIRHELGHSYGLPDHSAYTQCCMYYTSNGTILYPDVWCSNCQSTVIRNRNLY